MHRLFVAMIAIIGVCMLLAVSKVCARRTLTKTPEPAAARARAIVVLTRGYDLERQYSMLVDRTRALARQSWAASYDHIIFHEGNITIEQQEYIRRSVGAPFPLQFVDVRESYTRNIQRSKDGGNGCHTPADSRHGGHNVGYKFMCAFWFADFLDYVRPYEAVLRVDEDCIIEKHPFADPAPPLSTLVGSARIQNNMDDRRFTVGLGALARELSVELQVPHLRRWKSPYTNVLWINIPWALSERVQYIVRRVFETNCIMTNRWGDLPLWGMTAALLAAPLCVLRIPYYHRSHRTRIQNKRIGSDKCVSARM